MKTKETKQKKKIFTEGQTALFKECAVVALKAVIWTGVCVFAGAGCKNVLGMIEKKK